MNESQMQIVITAQYQQALQAFKELDSAVKKIGVSSKQLQPIATGIRTTMTGVGQSMIDFGRKTVAFGKQIQWSGQQLTMGLTLPIVYFAQKSIQAAQDFNYAMGTVAAAAGTTTEKTDKNFMAMQEAALEVGRTTLFSATEASKGLYELVSAGMSAADAAKNLVSAVHFAEAAQLDLGTATQFAAMMLKVFGDRNHDTTRLMDITAYAVQKSQAHFSDFTHNVQMSASFAKDANQSYEELAAALMVLADRGVPAAAAGFQLRQAFSQMIKPSNQAADAIAQLSKQLGYKGKENIFYTAAGNFKSLSTILVDLRKVTKGMTQEQRNATLATLFNVRAGQAMRTLLQLSNKDYKAYIDGVKNSAKVVEQMRTVIEKSNPLKIKENQLNEASIRIGQQLIPYKMKLYEWLMKLMDAYNNLSPAMQKLVINFAIGAAAIGPFLIYLGILVQTIGLFSSGLGLVIKELFLTEAQMTKLGSAIRILLNPGKLIVAVFTNVKAAVWAFRVAAAEAGGVLPGLVKGLKNTISAMSTLAFTTIAAEVAINIIIAALIAAAAVVYIFSKKYKSAFDQAEEANNRLANTMQVDMNTIKFSWKDLVIGMVETFTYGMVKLQPAWNKFKASWAAAKTETIGTGREISKMVNQVADDMVISLEEAGDKSYDEVTKFYASMIAITDDTRQKASQVGTAIASYIVKGMNDRQIVQEIKKSNFRFDAALQMATIETIARGGPESAGRALGIAVAMGMSVSSVIGYFKKNSIYLTESAIQPFIDAQIKAKNAGNALAAMVGVGMSATDSLTRVKKAGLQVSSAAVQEMAKAAVQFYGPGEAAVKYLAKGFGDKKAKALVAQAALAVQKEAVDYVISIMNKNPKYWEDPGRRQALYQEAGLVSMGPEIEQAWTTQSRKAAATNLNYVIKNQLGIDSGKTCGRNMSIGITQQGPTILSAAQNTINAIKNIKTGGLVSTGINIGISIAQGVMSASSSNWLGRARDWIISRFAGSLHPYTRRDGSIGFAWGHTGGIVTNYGIQRFQQGGMAQGVGNTDSVPAMLTPGEMILTRKQQAALVKNMQKEPQKQIVIKSLVINANTRAEGLEAGRAFKQELQSI